MIGGPYYVSSQTTAKSKWTNKRFAIRHARAVARQFIGSGYPKRKRQVSVRAGSPSGRLLYQCHAYHHGEQVRIAVEEL